MESSHGQENSKGEVEIGDEHGREEEHEKDWEQKRCKDRQRERDIEKQGGTWGRRWEKDTGVREVTLKLLEM